VLPAPRSLTHDLAGAGRSRARGAAATQAPAFVLAAFKPICHELWQADITHWPLANGTEVEILDINLERIREAVSDRGRGVRGRGESQPARAPAQEKGTAIMNLTTITNVSVDGVMQGLGGPDEDRSGGFERGGWAMPLFDNEGAAFVNQVYQRADAFLFGRRTYEIFAGYWRVMADSANPIAAPLNTRSKYVASHAHRPAMGGHDCPLR